MQRNYHTDTSQLPNHYELAKQTAFHEAGHAAAIHLRNKQKRLEPVNFEIQINKPSQPNQQFSAKVVDGLLIHNLSSALDTRLSERERRDQQRAFEADVVNLLVGPLAEARYVSIRDDEIFNQRLVNTKALQNYGGLSDVEHATHYLSAFISDHKQREKKMLELFNEAYRFIDNSSHWQCILNLAQYILQCKQDRLSCEEVIGIFDRCCNT